MTRSSPYTRRFSRINLSAFSYRSTEDGFVGPKSFRAVRETDKKQLENGLFFLALLFKGNWSNYTFLWMIEEYSQNTITVATAIQVAVPFVPVQLYCPASVLLMFLIVNWLDLPRSISSPTLLHVKLRPGTLVVFAVVQLMKSVSPSVRLVEFGRTLIMPAVWRESNN